MIVAKLILITTLIMVFIQDIKQREVYWFLFPIIAVCSATLLYTNTINSVFYTTIIINTIFILFLLTVVFFYSKFKLKTAVKNTFGLGDSFLFFALIFTFTSVSFLILFVFSLIFSLILQMFLKKQSQFKTVPLAGYISLFFAIVYVSHWLGFLPTLYTI